MPKSRPLSSLVLVLALLLTIAGALHAAPHRQPADVAAVPAGHPLPGTDEQLLTEDGRLKVIIDLSLSPGAVIWAREMEARRGLDRAAATAAAASATRSHLREVAAQQEG